MNAADRGTEAHALGFESAQDKIDYERKMLGDRFDIVPRMRAHQWKGFRALHYWLTHRPAWIDAAWEENP